MARGFGVAAALPLPVISAVAAAAEQHGFQTFWVNDTPGADGLAGLAAAAAATSRINLGVGVAPLDRRSPESLIARVEELVLPQERLILGVGSGAGPGGVERVRAGLATLHAALSAPVVIAALGPRMCRLAGEAADGVLYNWLTPEYTRASNALVEEAARAAGRPTPRLLAYVRTALPEGADRLQSEAARYGAIPAYAAHFTRMGVEPASTGVIGDAAAIQTGLAASRRCSTR
jgi:alkanesulfonate monooxygenase SsuD/methylene tetrahydromethanopterin reductase-like flavin-dependent oxidoreductase (luciferase family)